MLIYLVSLIVSVLLTKEAVKRKSNLILHFLAVAFPIILYTFRSPEVGSDTISYISAYGVYRDSVSFSESLLRSRFEIGFSLVMFILSRFSESHVLSFFVFGILTIVPIYFSAISFKDRLSPSLVMGLYYLIFFNYSFNTVRQLLAMSFICLATTYLLKGETKKTFIFWLISISFHYVSIIYGALFFAFKLKNSKYKIWVIILMAILSLVSIVLAQKYLVSSIEYYALMLDNAKETSIQTSYLLEMVLNFFICLIAWIKSKRQDVAFGVFVSGFVLFLLMFSYLFTYAFRIAFCFDILLLIFIPISIKSLKKFYFKFWYFAFALFFWWFVYVYNNSSQTIPYDFLT